MADAAVGPSSDTDPVLDILRGVGVLGMLAVHMQLFAFPSVARWNPTAYGDFTGLNWWVWLATELLADGKFITIFAMLLGVSIVMMANESGAPAIPAWRIHMRRMLVLLVLGLLHAHLVWFGDMLVPLAVSGAVVFFARRFSPAKLLVLGALTFATASVLSITLTWSTAQSDPAALAAWRAQWTPRPAIINLEIAQYRGGWLEQMHQRVPAALETETIQFVTRLLWQMTGLMLMGMALQARDPERRPFTGLLSADGRSGVRGRPPVDRARPLAERRNGVGPPGLRARQPAAGVFGRSFRGLGLGGPHDAGLPARLAASPGGGGGPAWPSPTTSCNR